MIQTTLKIIISIIIFVIFIIGWMMYEHYTFRKENLNRLQNNGTYHLIKSKIYIGQEEGEVIKFLKKQGFQILYDKNHDIKIRDQNLLIEISDGKVVDFIVIPY